jgi:hypothetical protein
MKGNFIKTGEEKGEQYNYIQYISEYLRYSVNIVQWTPAPPDASLKAAKDNFLAAFFIGKSKSYCIRSANKLH